MPRHPAVPEPPSPTARYLDQSVNLKTLPIPFVRFRGIKSVLPDCESVCTGLPDFIQELAPDPAPVIKYKDQVPYYIAGTIKEGELLNPKLRETRIRNGQSTVGKQRSSGHIETLGPGLLMDDDADVSAREPALRALGAAACMYSSHSFGFPKGGATEPARGGRVVLCLNRPVTTAEYGLAWDAVNHLLGGGFDPHGRSPALCYGRHSRRSDQAPYSRSIIDGAALDADGLVELGRSLRPEHSRAAPALRTTESRKRALAEEVERARLMGAVRAPDNYSEWVSGAAAFKRAYPDDDEAAFRCFDTWSACSEKYQGPEATRHKFDEVPAEYSGAAVPVTLDMLHWRARVCAETVIDASFSPATKRQPPHAPKGHVFESAAAGTPLPKGTEPTPSNILRPEDGIVALDYLRFCWSAKVYQQIVSGHVIPQEVLEQVLRRSEERCEKIELCGRILHSWGGKNLATDTAALADAIIASGAKLYRVDSALVHVSAPVSDQATAARIRKVYGYTGLPGEPGDPALHAGERLVTILPTDLEALREVIAANIAARRRVNRGTARMPDWQVEIGSFAFKPSAKLNVEPDAGVLKDLGKRALVAQVPEIIGIITAPVMPSLPLSTRLNDLLRPEADHIIKDPGFDSASGLYLSPLGTVVDVPDTPSQGQVKDATDFLMTPWFDFPFASPGAELSPDVGRSAAVYGMMIAANRRALDIAPGIGFSSHGEGMSSGKTLAGEVIGTIATGAVPVPVSLSTDFAEQRKEIITYFVEGDGSLFLDNIQTGARFDAAPLASGMTSARFRGRLLGANKQIEAGTRVMVIATGNSLNMAGDLSSRFLLVRLNTGLERPEDRSADKFKIPDLRSWVVEHRQKLVASIHTIVRAYLQECRRSNGTPQPVIDRRRVVGTRFGGQCGVLRDALLWGFPDLPDPFLSFHASALNSSTKAENALVIEVLDRAMAEAAGAKSAPAWATASWAATKSPQRRRWETNFRARWARMTPDWHQRRYGTSDLAEAENRAWGRIQELVRRRSGRREIRSGRARFTSSEIRQALRGDNEAIVDGAMHGKGLNPVSLGRWLKDRLVDAPTNDLVLRSAKDRTKRECFWIARQ
jgi:hypothetical protein